MFLVTCAQRVQLLGYCHTAAWLLPYSCLATAIQLLGYCHTAAWLLPYSCLATIIQLLGYCHTAAWLLPLFVVSLSAWLASSLRVRCAQLSMRCISRSSIALMLGPHACCFSLHIHTYIHTYMHAYIHTYIHTLMKECGWSQDAHICIWAPKYHHMVIRTGSYRDMHTQTHVTTYSRHTRAGICTFLCTKCAKLLRA
jgi:hypothetical protein